jgi:hypothetical protein
MGILGIYASSVLKVTNSYESIATVTVGSGGSSTITFSSIPSTFKHLQVRYIARNNRATFGNDAMILRFNSDSGNNYAWHSLKGDGGSANSGAVTSTNRILTDTSAGSGAPANTFGAGIIDILDYASTNKYKTARILSGVDVNGTVSGSGGVMQFSSGLWQNTAAITSIVITPDNPNFQEFSSFALYGIKE